MSATITHHPTTEGCCCTGPLVRGLGALGRHPTPSADHTIGPAPTDRPEGTTMILGATVLTVDAGFSTAEALAVRDGRIIAVGTTAEVAEAAGDGVETVERPGAFVLPGFIEPHAHVLPTALFGPWADVGPFTCATVDDALTALRDQAAGASAGEGWILGRQFDPSLQEGADELTVEQLDAVSAAVPVAVLNASLHLAYVNTAALRVAGITADTPDIDGSPYGRRADGHPNGVLKGQPAMLSVLAHNPALAEADFVAQGLAVTRRAASVGVTTICDQGTGGVLGPGDLDVYAEMVASGELATRLRYSVFDLSADGFDAVGLTPGQGDELVRATGWKIVSDGSNQGRTGHQREPYLGGDDRGIAYVDPDELREKVQRRADAGWQVVVHGNGDQAIDDILVAFEGAAGTGPHGDDGEGRRHRIEHCSILHDDQIERIAALGLSPSFLIGHVRFWGQAFRDDIFGPDKAALLDRTASCSAAGIPWTVHSDEMVTPMEPLRCIENAVTRRLWREPESVLAPAECVPVEDAIRAMTSTAAWQCHSEHEIGSLEVGKYADFVVLADDPRRVDPTAIDQIEILETWMDGKRTFSAGE